MATLIVRHRVANFDRWKLVFDEMGEARKKHGFTGHTLLRDAADPNLVTIVNRVKTLDGAKAYGASPELRGAFERAGILGQPDVTLCDDAEERVY